MHAGRESSWLRVPKRGRGGAYSPKSRERKKMLILV